MWKIWKGQGWVVPVIFIAAFFDVQGVIDSFMGEGFYQDNRWVKIVSVVSVAVLLGVIGVFMNHYARWQMRKKRSESQRTDIPHTLLFLPIEVWAIIIPCVFLGIDYFQEEQPDHTLTYLQKPKVNDIYSVDFTKIFKKEDPVYKYGTMVVVSVDLNVIEVHTSTHAYDGRSGVRKDLHSGAAKEALYYREETIPFNIRETVSFYERGGIFSVTRD